VRDKSPPISTARAIARYSIVVVGPLVCAGIVTAAVLVPAPPPALIAIVPACIVFPIMAAVELPDAVAFARDRLAKPVGRRRIARLQRDLSRLPETKHPLDL
jgi:hypothetical protein